MTDFKKSFWSVSAEDNLKNLDADKEGLTSSEANKRLSSYGPNSMKPTKSNSTFGLLISQFKSPIILILLFATGLSFFLMVMRPRKWDISFIRKFMVTFGLISSVFDFITFSVLMFIVHASTAQFRTGCLLNLLYLLH